MPVTLHEAGPDDLRWVDEAVRRCPVAMAEFGGFYAHASLRLPPLLGPDRTLLVIRRDGERVGFLDVDDVVGEESRGDAAYDDVLGLAWYVVPHARGDHVTATALGLLREQRPGRRLHAAIDPDNAASLATARRAGLRDTGVNRWGERVLVG